MSAMKDALSLLLTLSLLTLAAPPAASRQAHGDSPRRLRHERAADGSYIVVLKSGTDASEVVAAAERLTHLHGGRLVATYKHALKGFSVQLGERAAEALSRHPLVAYVEDDALVELASTTQTNAPWGLDRIDQRALPLSNTYTYANSGAGSHVYIIDSGIRTTHDEFGGRASVAFDNVGDSQNGEDCFGHGTQVAGVVGGATYGVAKGAELHAVRVFSCTNTSTLTKVIEGVDFVTSDHLSPAVAVLSVSTGGSTSLDTAVENSIAAGVTYVVAAGNINVDAGTRSPARVADAVTVGATDSTDTRASFSNYGSALDLFAPGVDIPTANWFSDSSTILQSGTSLAAAHTAGVAARYLSGNPQETPAEVSASLTGNATAEAVINPGTDSPNLLLYRPRGKVAYALESSDSLNREVAEVNIDGTDEVRLSNNGADEITPAWSPDGRKVAFASDRGDGYDSIFVMNSDGSNQTQITNSSFVYDYAPEWSPDGTKLVYQQYDENADRTKLYVINADGTNRIQFGASTIYNDAAYWSPDGTKIVFTGYASANSDIYMVNADGSGQVRLTTAAGDDYEPNWSPDGTKIVFTSSRDGRQEVYVMNSDGSSQTRLTTATGGSRSAVWSPDGSKIAFLSWRDGTAEIYVMNANGTSQTRLTNTAAGEKTLVWSPDGTKLVFVRNDSGNDRVYVMNSDGTNPVKITNLGSQNRNPRWQPL